MAARAVFGHNRRHQLRRNRLFRDRSHPFEMFDDVELYKKFRFRRQDILAITREVEHDLEVANRVYSLSPLLQVMISLRFYASGAFQDLVAETIRVDQSTVSRAITRVTDALLRRAPEWLQMPTQDEAEETKRHFFEEHGFPNVIGAIDGTQVEIQAPNENENEYVNRKNFHSINVQVICDRDLVFWNCIARWPGSVHDSRILRTSDLFRQFEGNNRPLNGIILGDSGYMVRDWLLTPLANPRNQAEENYNFHQCSARNTVERAIGVLKRRWHCLKRLRLQPEKACKVITVCVTLHNRATMLNLDVPDEEEDEEDGHDDEGEDEDSDDEAPEPNERARRAAGDAVRAQIIRNYFA